MEKKQQRQQQLNDITANNNVLGLQRQRGKYNKTKNYSEIDKQWISFKYTAYKYAVI